MQRTAPHRPAQVAQGKKYVNAQVAGGEKGKAANCLKRIFTRSNATPTHRTAQPQGQEFLTAREISLWKVVSKLKFLFGGPPSSDGPRARNIEPIEGFFCSTSGLIIFLAFFLYFHIFFIFSFLAIRLMRDV